MKQHKFTLRARSTWLVTFGDLLTLLLCFFIATFATKSPSPSSVTARTQNTIHSEPPKLALLNTQIQSGTSIALLPFVRLCVSESTRAETSDELLVRDLDWARAMGEQVRQLIDEGISPEVLRIEIGSDECNNDERSRIYVRKS